MSRKSYLILVLPLLVFFMANGYAQDSYGVSTKAPIIMNEPAENLSFQRTQPVLNENSLATWVYVDVMANSYGPAISILNPLAYDPASDVVAVVHRGEASYAQGSGEIWYNISTDQGATWTRVAAINASGTILGRYPNMAILNPTGGGISETSGLFSWPLLNPGAFGFLGAGVDQPLGGAATFSIEDQGPPTYSSQVLCFTSGDWFLWESDNQDNNSIRVFRTQDFGTIEIIDDPNLSDAAFGTGGNIALGGAEHNGVVFLGVLGSMPNSFPPIQSGWFPGYSKSTDNGATWSPIEVVDFRSIPALSAYDRIFDWKKGDAFISYNGDINVDKDGYVHLIVPLTDTTSGPNVGNNALAEIFETASGWDGKVIYEGIDDNIFSGFWNSANNNPGIGQMGPNGYLAMNANRDLLFAQWVSPPTPADTVFDIYYSWRQLDGDWSTPENLTNTPDINEMGSHLAPMLYDDGAGMAKAFSMYWYENGNTTPVVVTTNPTDVFIAAVGITYPTGVDDDILVNRFDLEQNYPNPFNPSTTINYSLAERSAVTLKVYDVLGNQVASLVNTTQEAGQHSINFDASSLSSGLYIYTLNTGNFTSSKKMMLLK